MDLQEFNAAVTAAAALRSRDPDLIDALVRQHQPGVFRYLLGFTRNRAAAEDLSQETWVHVLERGAQYQGNRDFRAWLMAIARHLAIDQARNERRRQRTSFDPWQRSRWLAETPLPDECVRRRETACRVDSAVRALPPRLRAVVSLRFGEGLPLPDIARRLHLVPGTVRSRLHRGVATLRMAVLAGEGSSFSGPDPETAARARADGSPWPATVRPSAATALRSLSPASGLPARCRPDSGRYG